MKLISYLSFFKAPLLLVFVCLFFVSEVSAFGYAEECYRIKDGYEFWTCNCEEVNSGRALDSCKEQANQAAEERKAIEEMANNEFLVDLASECVSLKNNHTEIWPSSCDCSQIKSSMDLDQCRNKVNNALGLVENCENRKKGLENVWDCNCQEVPSMYYGDIDGMGGDIESSLLIVESHLQGCQARAAGKAEPETRTLANVKKVDMTACDGESEPAICCETKRKFYGSSFWPGRCNCSNMRSAMQGTASVEERGRSSQQLSSAQQERVIGCIQEADQSVQVAKTECIPFCKNYVDTTTRGCDSKPDGNYCERTICKLEDSGLLEKSATGDPGIFLKDVESTLSRNNCLEESGKRFISAYKSKCLGHIKELQDEKRQTIICKEGAPKESPGCDDYCEKKANNKYGTNSPSGDEIVNYYYNNHITGDR